MNRILEKLLLFLLMLIFWSPGCKIDDESKSSIKIGVMLNVGSWSLNTEALEWAVENVNKAGGASGGRKLELVYRDSSNENDILSISEEFITDSSIKAVIGPRSNQQLYEIAPLFIKGKKVLVSPTSTSGIIPRAYGGKNYIWRTTESDIAQTETLVLMANEKGAEKIALLTGFDDYSNTFFDWFGFFATELGIEVTNIERFDQYESICDEHVDKLMQDNPDMLFAAPGNKTQAVCIAKRMRLRYPGTPLFFSDKGFEEDIFHTLGELADGIEGLTMAPAPESGFEIAWKYKFGTDVPNYAANLYDAVLLIAYGLKESKGKDSEQLSEAIKRVVGFRGYDVGWDEDGVNNALSGIGKSLRPNISGASGPLNYDSTVYTDLTETVYGVWRIEHGRFLFVDYYATGNSLIRTKDNQSIFQKRASEAAMQKYGTGSYEPPYDYENLAVVIVSLSTGWDNYRHQSDAMAQYQLFKSRGISDDQIIMIGADDIAYHEKNPLQGEVYNKEDGSNVYKDVKYDYSPEELTPKNLMDILSGNATAETPVVLDSDTSTNIYLFFVGHGGKRGLALAAETPEEATDEGDSFEFLTADIFQETIQFMYDNNRYRRMLITVEACHGQVMGKKIDSPGVLFMSASNENENSFSFAYDHELGIWLADQFAYYFYALVSQEEFIYNLYDLYQEVYLAVAGSHVTMENTTNFGDISSVEITEFMFP